MVVRSYKGTHSCYPTGTVTLYTAPKIIVDFLNEFRTNPNLKADQIMQRLALFVFLRQNVRVQGK